MIRVYNIWIILITLLISNQYAFAQTNILNGTDFTDNQNGLKSFSLSDQLYPNYPYNIRSQFAEITLEFIHDNNTLVSGDFQLTVDLNVNLVDINGVSSSVSRKMSIDYNSNPGKKYIDLHKVKLDNIAEIDVTIININPVVNGSFIFTDIQHMINLELEIISDYYYDFKDDPPTGIGNTYLPYSNELKIDWDADQTSTAYDLEWTFVSNDNGLGGLITSSDLEYSFRHNCSRINTKNNFYEIPLIYESGWIVYRVRKIGRLEDNGTLYNVYGQWSCSESGTVLSADDKFQFDGHEKELNWQYSVNFVEEGKRKVIVSYYDGLFKNRQVVSHINSLDKSIVAETIYDHEGRSALEILPVPIESSSLNYKDNFNLYNNKPISANDFDVNNSSCHPASIVLDNSNGASRYYSVNNNSSSIFKDYIDDANGYPYIQNQYTLDQTGRVRKISGIGESHALGSGHEIVNYYESVTDNRIQRLFGSEVGDKDHYSRHLIKNANGQYTVSYLDLKDNVIATSIIGESPDNLLPLDSTIYKDNQFSELIEENLIPYDNIPNIDNELTLTHNLVIPFSSEVSLSYELNAPYYKDVCLPNQCFDCVYELDINFINECGDVIDDVDYNKQLGTITSSTVCQGQQYTLYPFGTQKKKLLEGQYFLDKKLKIKQESIDYYADYYLQNNTCLITYNDFLREELDALDFSLCNISCCGDSVLDIQQIIPDLDYQTSIQTEPCGDDSLTNKFSDIMQLCDQTVSVCNNTIEIMKADFYPGGQYALYQTNYTSNDPTSIFAANSLTIAYNNSSINYLDVNGNAAVVNGLRPQDLSVKDFIDNFDPTWADALVEYHPEYCYTGFCNVISSSDDFDFKIASISLHQKGENYALSANNEAKGVSVPQLNQFKDPIWSILPSKYKSQLANKVTDFMELNGVKINIWQTSMHLASQQLPNNSSVDLLNLQWNIFKGLYIGVKTEILEDYRNEYLLDNNCCNSCIGNDRFSKDDVCCKEKKLMKPLQCCKSKLPCACEVKASFFNSKEKRFLTFEDAFDLAGYDINDLESLESVAKNETKNNCCDKLETPRDIPLKEGMVSEDGNWIAVSVDGLKKGVKVDARKERFRWICNLSPPHCDNTVIMQKPYENPCVKELVSVAQVNANRRYHEYLEQEKEKFIENYVSACLDVRESLIQKKKEKEYHYTLFYYDQSNNLIMTVPPKGVDPLNQGKDAAKFHDLKQQHIGGYYKILHPEHNFELATEYTYNSLNQLISQESPDGGLTQFWYDDMGRNILSQNAKQRNDDKFTYTKYDDLNRVIEVGELKTNSKLKKKNNVIIYKSFENNITRNPYKLKQFISSGSKSQITNTYYDVKYKDANVEDQFTNKQQKNLRNRISGVTIDHDGIGGYEYGTFYSYDIAGNVDELIQHNKALPSPIASKHAFKKINYDYDLLSGNVNMVSYQNRKEDQFYHKYMYDEENRIIDVLTSLDGVIWKNDARYFYYDHGPLARMELGDHNVQGIDYAYNMQGWIKGVNSTSLNPEKDMGHDGIMDGSINSTFATDAFSYGLSYYNGDYKPIGNSNWEAKQQGSGIDNGELFNGNIRNMTTSIEEFMDPHGSFGTTYTYDQLNRIKTMESFQGLDETTNSWVTSQSGIANAYNTEYTYDPNGNILGLNRNTETGTPLDNLNYNYTADKNQLEYVQDAAGIKNNDIGTQNPNNYTYDAIGNLIKDNAEGITNIDWNLYGKIMNIEKSGDDLTFAYDPTGNRIKKETDIQTLWYVRDATGNVMAIYLFNNTSNKFYLQEYPIYGTKRIASNKINKELTGTVADDDFVFIRANKQFELTNHLGNVLTTVSDKKLQIVDNGVFTHFKADILTANDYYPFGMQMDNRNYSLNSSEHIYGFNGKEMDNEVSGSGNQYDFGARIYNSRIARFLTIDPLIKEYPWYTPYQFAGNKPINSIDLDGLKEYPTIQELFKDAFNSSFLAENYEFNGQGVGQIFSLHKSNGINTTYRVLKTENKDDITYSLQMYHSGWKNASPPFQVGIQAMHDVMNVAKLIPVAQLVPVAADFISKFFYFFDDSYSKGDYGTSDFAVDQLGAVVTVGSQVYSVYNFGASSLTTNKEILKASAESLGINIVQGVVEYGAKWSFDIMLGEGEKLSYEYKKGDIQGGSYEKRFKDGSLLMMPLSQDQLPSNDKKLNGHLEDYVPQVIKGSMKFKDED